MLHTQRPEIIRPNSNLAYGAAGALHKPKALLVEDDRTMRRLVRAKIKDHCDLLVAGNANLGANLFKSEKPDIVFIDIELPDTSGYNLLEWMMNHNKDVFAVMFSGHDDNQHVWKSVEIGAKGFVSKPFNLNKMLFFLDQCMA